MGRVLTPAVRQSTIDECKMTLTFSTSWCRRALFQACVPIFAIPIAALRFRLGILVKEEPMCKASALRTGAYSFPGLTLLTNSITDEVQPSS